MSRVADRDNYRVIVWPRTHTYGIPHGDPAETCKDILNQIKRHIDEVETVEITSDKADSCSHCGACWTEDGDDYNGGCCDEDEKGNPEPEPKEAAP